MVRRLAIVLALTFGVITGTALRASAQIRLEAEKGILTGTQISSAAAGYSGTGYVTGFDNDGDRVRWTFTATPGFYRLHIRFRTPFGEKGFNATLNGVSFSGMFPASPGFASFDAGFVEVVGGSNSLEIGGGWSYYEIDRVDLTPIPVPVPPRPVPPLLVDPQATLAARMLMADLAADYGRVTWSGQVDAEEVTNVFKLTGRRPVIVAGDLVEYSPSRLAFGSNPRNHTETMIAMEALGHVQSMGWHWNAPTNLLNTAGHEWWAGFYTHATTFDVSAAMANTNSAGYRLMLRDIDAIAVQLKKFSARNIPVLWRPLHEAEGTWFWWGAKGPGPYKALWRLLFTRLTVTHGLHNLIWVLTSEDPAWYPGDDVVDILGVDAYPEDRSDPLSGRWESLKARFDGRKIIALTEFGGVPDIEKMHQFGVWFSYFAPWSGSLGPGSASAELRTRIYGSSQVVTLEEASAVPPRVIGYERTSGGAFHLTGKGVRGATHRILAAPSLTAPPSAWIPVSTNKAPGGVFEFLDPGSAGRPGRFYRVVRP